MLVKLEGATNNSVTERHIAECGMSCVCLCECRALWLFVFILVDIIIQDGLKLQKFMCEKSVCKRG
jgi:hypothetical protein